MGLCKGDQIQGWICSTVDKADYTQVLPRDSYKMAAHGGHILQRLVDEKTQEMLDSGGSCRIYVNLSKGSCMSVPNDLFCRSLPRQNFRSRGPVGSVGSVYKIHELAVQAAFPIVYILYI
jgi:hypothetical protein